MTETEKEQHHHSGLHLHHHKKVHAHGHENSITHPPHLAKDLQYHLSEEAKLRKPSPLKVAFKHFHDPRIVSLGGGLPLPDLFPFNEITVSTLAPPFARGVDVIPETDEEELKVVLRKDKNNLTHEKDTPLETALQYGNSAGLSELSDFIKEHTRIVHHPQYKDWDIVTTVGNTQAWDSTLRTFANRGDVILTEEFTFPSASETAHANGVTCVPVKVDLEGIIPEELEKLLSNWEGPSPKLLYTIPTGQNPTGGTLSLERRKKIYEICKQFDIIIVEDEPYYFLQMDEFKPGSSNQELPPAPTHEEFLKSLVPSYLSIDTEGRVIRLDSFSKVIAPGTRLGWIVAQERFIERYLRQHEVTIQIASGFSQSILNGILHRWGQAGYIDWLIQLRFNYTIKRNLCLDVVEKYIPKEVCEWIAPSAGMFFWIRVDASKSPHYNSLQFHRDPAKVETHVYEKGLENGVLMIPGHWFVIEDERKHHLIHRDGRQYMYFRGTFASVKPDALEEGIKRFGETLRADFQLN